jgi:hypothetical protein
MGELSADPVRACQVSASTTSCRKRAWHPTHDSSVVVSIVLVIAHLLKAHGFVGLSRLDGGGPVVRWSMLAVASMVGGTVIVRRNLLEGFGRWSVLLSGAFMIFVVTPALFTGRGPLAYLALTGWSLFLIWIGRALARTENGWSS